MKSQRGGIAVNILIILFLVGACALMFVLLNKSTKTSDVTDAIKDPSTIQHTTRKTTLTNTEFSDGLGTPDKITHGTLDDFGAGTESIAEFYRDINQDGKTDRITRTHIETGNAHDYNEYKIELNNNGIMQDITPQGFRTTKGADCALRLIQFHFSPKFSATIISRPFKDTWDTPSLATKTEYNIQDNQIVSGTNQPLNSVCDVSKLF